MEGKPLVMSKQTTAVVCGVPTQVVCTAFSSHILVVVTQFGKMGTLVSLESSSMTSDISKPVLTTKVLLGQDEVKGWGREPGGYNLLIHTGSISGQTPPRPPPPALDSVFRGLSASEGVHLPLVAAASSPSAFYPADRRRY